MWTPIAFLTRVAWVNKLEVAVGKYLHIASRWNVADIFIADTEKEILPFVWTNQAVIFIKVTYYKDTSFFAIFFFS